MPQSSDLNPGSTTTDAARPVNPAQSRQALQRPDPLPPVCDMDKDTRGEGYLLVRAAEQRVSSNGSKYLDMTLCDRTGEINAKVWDTQQKPPDTGTILKVRGQVLVYNGKPQLRVERFADVTGSDAVPLDNLVPCAPLDPNYMMAEIRGIVQSIGDKGLRDLATMCLDHAGDALLTCPAAFKLHHAERGGLLHHTLGMARLALSFCELYPVLDRDLLLTGVVAHDLAKVNEMTLDAVGMVKEYSADGNLIGHLVRGIVNVELAARELGLDQQTTMLIQHMILSHHGQPEFGSPIKPMFIEAEILHVIDLADARIFEMSQAISKLRPGTFSEKIWSLDRRLYRTTRDCLSPKEDLDE